MPNNNIVYDGSTWEKRKFGVGNNFFKNSFKSISNSFSYYFVIDIAKRYGPEVPN